jgi:hypothetical protein
VNRPWTCLAALANINLVHIVTQRRAFILPGLEADIGHPLKPGCMVELQGSRPSTHFRVAPKVTTIVFSSLQSLVSRGALRLGARSYSQSFAQRMRQG